MRLKTLEIVGFKSFADPFRIDFKRGIAAVVGPNGCGKSNVADAIRWVLGTQSPRQLRTEKMESVIFSGSTGRKPLGMAEVTLTFDNSDRTLGLDYDEVSVSRRLFRSGESEYSINGSRCRLMDVTDLVVDRGLGSTGYWILESKMVSRILSSRPEDRRFLFDEAAGIVKYKIQRHRAELKLKSAASDLERLSDIISEVKSTCNGLKRQVSAYRKYERITGTISSLKEAVGYLESTALNRELDSLREQLEETGTVVGRETALLAASSAKLSELKTEYEMVQKKLDDAHSECSGLDLKLASADREKALAVQQIVSLEARIAENTARTARERERAQLYTRDIEELLLEKDSILPVRSRLEEEKKDLQRETGKMRQNVSAAGDRLRETRKSLEEIEKKAASARENYRAVVRKEEAARQRRAMLLERGRLLESSIGETEEGIAELEESRRSSQSSLSALLPRGKELASLLEKLREEYENLRQRLSKLESEAAVLRAAGKELKEASARSGSLKDSISAVIRPLDGMGKALGAFLMGFQDALPLDSSGTGEGFRGVFYMETPFSSPWKEPEDAVTLDRCIEDGEKTPVIASVLRNGLLAPDRDRALDWIRGGCPVPVVTPEGDLFRPEGFTRLGVERDSAGSLELSQLIDENLAEQEKVAGIADTVKDGIQEKREAIQTIQEDLSANDREKAELERKLSVTVSSMEAGNRELERLKEELGSAALELEKISTESSGGHEEYTESVRKLEEERALLSEKEQGAYRTLSEKEALLAAGIRKMDSVDYSLREKENREKEIAQRISLLEAEGERIEEAIDELGRNSEESARLKVSAGERQEELHRETGTLRELRGSAEKRRTELSTARNSLMEKTAVQEKSVQQTRERLSKARSRMIELQTRADSREEKLSAMEGSLPSNDNPYLELTGDELKRRLEQEYAAREKIGPVNMLAVSEYEEASARHDYLSEQKKDLEDAGASLARAIREINEEAARRFSETFEKVRENFHEMFRKLFGGGEGDIISVQGDDPLEGGIDILARPRGKKLKNVIALSQGEKAMTAVALLFSLYLVKPSPFCVLDELDAPFDDSNIDKFTTILRDFSRDIQFIVITHNKRTMEGSDVLYGITMAEEGVSSITSVNLEEMVSES